MAPCRFSSMPVEIDPPEFAQLGQRHWRQRFKHFLPFPYAKFPSFTQSIYPYSRSVCPAVLGFPLGVEAPMRSLLTEQSEDAHVETLVLVLVGNTGDHRGFGGGCANDELVSRWMD